jgi:hypothetical protein
MTESNAVQRLSRIARRQGLMLSTRQNPVPRYRLIDRRTGHVAKETASLADVGQYLAAADAKSAIYADYYLRL